LLTSLLAFLVSVCGRLFLEFRLLERKRLAVTALLLMGSLLCFLVSHVNASLHCWEHLGGMTMEVVQLIWARIDRPLTFLAVIMATVGTVLGAIDIYLAINNPNVAEEDLQARKAY
jgi:di/tricarboxylate transporter